MDIIIEILKAIILSILMGFIVFVTIVCGFIMDIPSTIIKILVIGEILFSVVGGYKN